MCIMIELLETIAIYGVMIIGAVAVFLDSIGFFDSDEDNRYHLSDIDDLYDFQGSLDDETQKFLSKEIKKYKQK